MNEITFLNDKKVDAELYAYLQSISHKDNNTGETRVDKWDLPKQAEICKIIGVASPKTYRSHLEYLKERGFVVEDENGWVLPQCEIFYLLLPLDTICFMQDIYRENVVKVYIYLGQKWKNAKVEDDKEFTYEDIAIHVGIKLKGNVRGYENIRNILTALSAVGLITISNEYFVGKGQSRHRLLNWTTDHIKLEDMVR